MNTNTPSGDFLYTLEDAAEKILQEKGMQITDDEVRQQCIADIVDSISDRINAEIIEAMNDNQRTDFDKLVDTNADARTVREFISANVSNLPDIIATSILEVRNTYLAQ